jgi:hypothetical protein
MEVSTPSHPRYGQHLKRDELKDLIKPRAESTATVLSWLEQSGIEAKDIHADGEWINFYAPVNRAEEMMTTYFKTYQSEVRPDVKKIRSLGYSVPVEVRSHIDMIQPVRTTCFTSISQAECHLEMSRSAPGSSKPVLTTVRQLASARSDQSAARCLPRRRVRSQFSLLTPRATTGSLPIVFRSCTSSRTTSPAARSTPLSVSLASWSSISDSPTMSALRGCSLQRLPIPSDLCR